MNRLKLLISSAFLLMSAESIAFQNDIAQLEGASIVKAGTIGRVSCPPYGKYDCLNWPSDLYEFENKNICMRTGIGFGCSLSCEGFLANKNGQISLYTISTLGISSTLKQSSVELLQCPSKY